MRRRSLYVKQFNGSCLLHTSECSLLQVNERFTFKIPDGIPLEVCGPLLCAGVTTFAPLARYAKAGDRVAIVGIGGLGHMALQYAAAMGCEVWALSTSPSKEAEARKFGATNFLVTSDAEAMKAMKNKFDFILCAASGNFSVDAYTKLLKPRKSFCLVGLPAVDTPLSVSAPKVMYYILMST
jgi:D-arabinose 1-dehydrogenase-like Zn-dependent alcohol dehydrogenase